MAKEPLDVKQDGDDDLMDDYEHEEVWLSSSPLYCCIAPGPFATRHSKAAELILPHRLLPPSPQIVARSESDEYMLADISNATDEYMLCTTLKDGNMRCDGSPPERSRLNRPLQCHWVPNETRLVLTALVLWCC